MKVNPFYVHPGGDFGPGLQGLAQTVGDIGADKRKRQAEQNAAEKFSAMKQGAVAAYQSGDYNTMIEFGLANPEFGEAMRATAGHLNEQTEQNYYDSMYEVIQDSSTENIARVQASRQKFLRQQGVDPEFSKETDGFIEKFNQNPEKAKSDMLAELSFRDGDRAKKFLEAKGIGGKDTRTPDVKNYEYAKGQGFNGSFLDFQVSGKDTSGSTTAIKEFEYGEKNPRFALAQKAKTDAKNKKEVAKTDFKDVSALRKEFIANSSEFQKVRDSYTRVVGSTNNPSPAGDLSLIFNYMKMLDPGSVVRESEFATAASAGSYGDRMQASVQKVMSGERLTPKMRKDFITKSGELYKGMQEQHRKREGSYRQIAIDNQFNPEEVVIDITAPTENATPTITSQVEFDNLPSGTVYTEDGKQYRKP